MRAPQVAVLLVVGVLRLQRLTCGHAGTCLMSTSCGYQRTSMSLWAMCGRQSFGQHLPTIPSQRPSPRRPLEPPPSRPNPPARRSATARRSAASAPTPHQLVQRLPKQPHLVTPRRQLRRRLLLCRRSLRATGLLRPSELASAGAPRNDVKTGCVDTDHDFILQPKNHNAPFFWTRLRPTTHVADECARRSGQLGNPRSRRLRSTHLPHPRGCVRVC